MPAKGALPPQEPFQLTRSKRTRQVVSSGRMIPPRIGVRNGVSLVCGLLIGYCLSVLISRGLWHSQPRSTAGKGEFLTGRSMAQASAPNSLATEWVDVRRKPLYVGVISAGKYLNTRMAACNLTWASNLPSDQVEYYVGSLNGQNPHGLRVVELPGANDDEYPPQGKAFRMLRHICEHHINHFNWFLRADDDVYFRVDKLLHWLDGLDPEDKLYIGQAGYGREKDKFRLKLQDANFCMGGPGVIFSQAMLKSICPHIDSCMKDDITLTTGEEDVEIGRCLYNHVGARCTSAYEFMKLFYHAYPHEYSLHPYTGDLSKSKWQSVFSKGLSFHHIKIPHIMFSLEKYFLVSDTGSQRNQALSLGRRLDAIQSNWQNTRSNFKLPDVPSMADLLQTSSNQGLLKVNVASQTQSEQFNADQLAWGFADSGGDYGNIRLFSPSLFSNGNLKYFGKPLVEFLSKNITNGFSVDKVKNVFYSVSPLYGLHAHVTLELTKTEGMETTGSTSPKKLCQVNMKYTFEEEAGVTTQLVDYNSNRPLSVVVPLAPIHYSLFQPFMQNFEKVFLKPTSESEEGTSAALQANLYVIMFPDAVLLPRSSANSPALEPSVLASLFQSKYKGVHIRAVTVKGTFSVQKALSVGMQASLEDLDRSKDTNPVILLTSVETVLFDGLGDRCQIQALAGEIFFPIPCSMPGDANLPCDDSKVGGEVEWLLDSYSHVCALASSIAPMLANSTLKGDMHSFYADLVRARSTLVRQPTFAKKQTFEVLRSFEPRMKVSPTQTPTQCATLRQSTQNVGDALPSCLL